MRCSSRSKPPGRGRSRRGFPPGCGRRRSGYHQRSTVRARMSRARSRVPGRRGGVFGDDADGPGELWRLSARRCGRAGVGLGEGGLGVGEDQAVAGADVELGRVADEIGGARVAVLAGVDEHGVGCVVMVGDGGVGDAPGGVAAQGRGDSADRRGAAPVVGQLVAAQPPGEAASARWRRRGSRRWPGRGRRRRSGAGRASWSWLRMYRSAAEQSCASSTTSSAYLAVQQRAERRPCGPRGCGRRARAVRRR